MNSGLESYGYLIAAALRAQGFWVHGHDWVAPVASVAELGFEPVDDLATGLRQARAVMVMEMHSEYARLDWAALTQEMQAPAVLYDCWRGLEARAATLAAGVRYASIGYDT